MERSWDHRSLFVEVVVWHRDEPGATHPGNKQRLAMNDQKRLVILAAKGIGRKLVELLHRDGCLLVLAGRTPDFLSEVAATCVGKLLE
ncbi:MAG: hypothetical protein U0640_02320 [Phycisphaerales bacterium]